jgi:hypothetical protein
VNHCPRCDAELVSQADRKIIGHDVP